MNYWTIVHRGSNEPVVPFDCNPRSQDEGMLVYRTRQAACAAAAHQRRLYEVDAVPISLAMFTEAESRTRAGGDDE